MKQGLPDITTTHFVLPPDSKFLPVSELSARLRAKIGPVDDGQSVITRPGFRITTRLVPRPLATLISEFREPSLLTDAVLRFSQAHDQDPLDTLDLTFDALATLVEARILVPVDSPDTQAPVPSLAAGQEFAGFEIETLVRSLEDTEVYQVRQRSGGSAALKIARDDRPAVARMLTNESSMLDLLGGADTPKPLAHGVERGRAYLVSEWCEGVSIAIAAQQARASRDRLRLHRVVTHMLEAYGRLHARGVLHGDIHPGNCLVRDDGRVVILDFGSARLIVGRDAPDPARAGIPHFYDPMMARALLDGRIPPAATPASEQFAVSVLAYILLTGLYPVEAPAVQDELLHNIVDRSPLPFTARGVTAWPAVEAIIRRGLAKQAGERFDHVADLARAFALAGRKSGRCRHWQAPAECQLRSVIEEVRTLQSSPENALHRAWFALRAALAIDDAELLAAADLLAGRAGPGWAAQSVVARIARARSDNATERQAMERFLAVVEPLADGPEALAAILTAAELLDGATSRNAHAAPLASWASRRLDQLISAQSTIGKTESVAEPLLAFAALSLGKTGTVTFPDSLLTRLNALGKVPECGVWLWALADDVFAHPHFKALALAAKRPRDAVARGFALLRLHQLTGDMRWVAEARRLVTRHRGNPVSERHFALLMIELKMPETAILPSFLFTETISRSSVCR